MSHQPYRVLVVGAGAIGVYFASRLAQSGFAEVAVISRSDSEALAANHGEYEVQSCLGDYRFRPEHVYRSAAEMPEKPDIILCALKVLPGVDPVALCRDAVGPHTSFLVIQNGVHNEDPFYAAFPDHEIIGAVAYIGAQRPRPGLVLHLDGGTLIMGEFPVGRAPSARMLAAAMAFEHAGVGVTLIDNIEEKRWYKLLWNASFNSVSVLGHSADTQNIMALPEAVALIEAVMWEVVEIASAEGVTLNPEAVRQNVDYTRSFAAYKPSTLQDFEAGRPIELEAILGVPLRIADRHGLKVPHMRTLYALLKLASRKLR